MGNDPVFFPEMVNTAGGLLPALVSLGIVVTRQARCQLGTGTQLFLVVFSLALSALFTRVVITPDEQSLYIVPGATLVVCYLSWRGYVLSPGLAFALTYASLLPVDFLLAQQAFGASFNPEYIGGAGWRDGLLVFPTLTALAVMYANWRMIRVGRAGLIWMGQRSGGSGLRGQPPDHDKSGLISASGNASARTPLRCALTQRNGDGPPYSPR
jgi:hypothetical protein